VREEEDEEEEEDAARDSLWRNPPSTNTKDM